MAVTITAQRHAHDVHFACKVQTAEGSGATLTSGSAFAITSWRPTFEIAELVKPGSTGSRELEVNEVKHGIVTPRFTVGGVVGYGTDVLANGEALAALLEGALGSRAAPSTVNFNFANTLPFLTCAVKEGASQYRLFTDCQVARLRLESSRDDQLTFEADLVAKTYASGTSTFTAPDPANIGVPWIHAGMLTASIDSSDQAGSRCSVEITNKVEVVHTTGRYPTALRYSGKNDITVEIDVVPERKLRDWFADAVALDQEYTGASFAWVNAGNSKTLTAVFGALKLTNAPLAALNDGALDEVVAMTFRAVKTGSTAALQITHTA